MHWGQETRGKSCLVCFCDNGEIGVFQNFERHSQNRSIVKDTVSSVAGAAFHLGRATMAKVLDPQHHVLVFSEILRAPLTTTKNHAKALKDRAGSSQQPVIMIHVHIAASSRFMSTQYIHGLDSHDARVSSFCDSMTTG